MTVSAGRMTMTISGRTFKLHDSDSNVGLNDNFGDLEDIFTGELNPPLGSLKPGDQATILPEGTRRDAAGKLELADVDWDRQPDDVAPWPMYDNLARRVWLWYAHVYTYTVCPSPGVCTPKQLVTEFSSKQWLEAGSAMSYGAARTIGHGDWRKTRSVDSLVNSMLRHSAKSLGRCGYKVELVDPEPGRYHREHVVANVLMLSLLEGT